MRKKLLKKGYKGEKTLIFNEHKRMNDEKLSFNYN